MIEEKKNMKHNIILESRENISITGVLDVLSFDEQEIICDTEMGNLILEGTNLHVSKLNLDSGELEIDGEISSLHYEEENNFKNHKGSFFGKIFK